MIKVHWVDIDFKKTIFPSENTLLKFLKANDFVNDALRIINNNSEIWIGTCPYAEEICYEKLAIFGYSLEELENISYEAGQDI